MSPWVPPYRGAYGSLGLLGLLLPEKETGRKEPGPRRHFPGRCVKIFEIDPTSDSSPWGRRASASLQPGETTFDADQTAREFWQGKTPTRAPTLSEFQRYMVERIKAYFQVRWRCVRPWWWPPMAAIPLSGTTPACRLRTWALLQMCSGCGCPGTRTARRFSSTPIAAELCS